MMQRWSAFAIVFGLLAGLSSAQDDVKADKTPSIPQLAHIRLAGALDETPVAVDPLFGSHAENFKTKLERIRKATGDKNVQGLVLHLDGLQIGYAKMEELRKAIAEFRRSGKKVYTYL